MNEHANEEKQTESNVGSSTDPGKSGDAIKYVILLAFVGIAAYLFYVDTNVTTPATETALQEIADACEDQEGFDPEKVQEVAGFEPVSADEKDGGILVEKYVFKRALPILTSAKLYAIYADGVLRKVVQDEELAEGDVEWVRTRFSKKKVVLPSDVPQESDEDTESDDASKTDESKTDESKTDESKTDDAKAKDEGASEDSNDSADEASEEGSDSKEGTSEEDASDEGFSDDENDQ